MHGTRRAVTQDAERGSGEEENEMTFVRQSRSYDRGVRTQRKLRRRGRTRVLDMDGAVTEKAGGDRLKRKNVESVPQAILREVCRRGQLVAVPDEKRRA